MTVTPHYDLAIIGSGSGNSLVTPDFADRRVAIIEEGVFGGTCLNVGCIPTKMYVHAGDVAAAARDSARFGVDARVDGVRWRDVRDRVFGRIDPISAGGRDYRVHGPNTTAYLGHGEFVGERRLRVHTEAGEQELTADQVVIATGARATVPEVIREAGVDYHTSDTVMRLDDLPDSLVVVGGGYIASEFAHVFSAFGTAVTLVVRGPALLRHLDGALSRAFTEVAGRAWDLRLGRVPVGAERVDGGVRLLLDDGTTAEGETLLVASGRVPRTDGLGLDRAGVAVHPDGRVVVDAYGRTSAPGVWALGDACSPYQLKHVANAEARAVAHNLVHPDDLRPFTHHAVPSAVFTRPQLAQVGATEEELIAQGRPYVVKVQRYADTAYGWALEDEDGICKVLADPDSGLLLGAHIMGPEAAALIQPAVQAMALRTPVDVVARGQYWIHPALTEVLENALLGLELPGRSG